MADPVCAVVVTHNRKELLAESLRALLGQTHAVDEILIVDNASTDGTPEMLAAHGYLQNPVVRHLRLPSNVGGAGGFHAGIKAAYEHGHTWIWLLDDDTIPQPEALSALLIARDRFPAGERPDLLASRVLWTDGTPHPMNTCIAKRSPDPTIALAQRHGVESIRATSFVSMLFHRRFVDAFALPLADYFIWSDDIEYTARILRDNFGVVVSESTVVHKTPRKHSSITAEPSRFYYHVRNTCWMLLHSDAWSWRERRPQIASLGLTIQAAVRRSAARWAMIRAASRGLRDGVFRRPRSTKLHVAAVTEP